MKAITLGILGGGQLGRMSALAAARLGIPVIIFCPEENCPASHVAKETITATYDNRDALKEFSEKVDVITYEFENIPVETIDYLEKLNPGSVLPDKTLLDVSQDRLKEKAFLNEIGIETTLWTKFDGIKNLKKTLERWRANAFILKTARMGYDGKGQIFGLADSIDNKEIADFLYYHEGRSIIIEKAVRFTCEISVIIARDKEGKTATYGPMLNEHAHHILHKTIIPAALPDDICAEAIRMGEKLAKAVNLNGVLTLELFLTQNNQLLANEIAPRTHNSGHWTIDACAVSQFENHVRTVCGLPVGSSTRHSDAVMTNLIGDDVRTAQDYLTQQNACLHLYGKNEPRKGRKMGHVTHLKEKTT